MIRGIPLLLIAIFACTLPAAAADTSTVATLWPLFDYRASDPADYQSLHLLGPFIKYETKGTETETALRPLFYRAADQDGASSTEVLYPLFGYKSEKDSSGFHLLHLLNYDYGASEKGSRNRSYLFPFFFTGEEEQGRYLAVFPFAGTLYNWFGRDRISFTLFPLYSRTERGDTRVDNILWPFLAGISGPDESGFKFWPIYGESRKQGVYRKKFFLWPIFFSESLALDSDNPVETRAVWPLYVSKTSPKDSSLHLLWPFFSRIEKNHGDYLAWNAPWPLVRVLNGKKAHGLKILPLYSDETVDVKRQRWYLWPIYKIEEMNSELIEQRRDRLLFFLYSDFRELRKESGESVRRVDFWPLFTYRRSHGVSQLHVFSLAEPFFPGNRSIENLWSPLWRIYQQKWDGQGNRVVSLFWNLFWQERQGDKVAWEISPLVEYRREPGISTEFRLLKGLIAFRDDTGGRQLKLFYLPRGLHWNTQAAGTM